MSQLPSFIISYPLIVHTKLARRSLKQVIMFIGFNLRLGRGLILSLIKIAATVLAILFSRTQLNLGHLFSQDFYVHPAVSCGRIPRDYRLPFPLDNATIKPKSNIFSSGMLSQNFIRFKIDILLHALTVNAF